MSATRERHKDTPKGDDLISSLISALARSQESSLPAPSPQPANAEADQHPAPVPDEPPKGDKVLAALLQAVDSTELATNLQGEAPDFAETCEPVPVEPPQSDANISAPLPTLVSPPPVEPLQVAAALSQLRNLTPAEVQSSDETLATLLRAVQSTELAAHLQEVAQGYARSKKHMHIVPAREPVYHPSSWVHDTPTKMAAGEGASVGARQSPPESVENRSLVALFFARLKGEISRLAPKIGLTGFPMVQAPEQLSKWPLDQLPPQLRRSLRLVKPPLAAYCWTAGPPQPHQVANISSSGIYLLTDDCWHPGSVVSMTLQRTDLERGSLGSWIAVIIMVVRRGNNGVGGAFIPSMPDLAYLAATGIENFADKITLDCFLEQLAVSTPPKATAPRSGHRLVF